jgi:hypothetical protein
MRHEIARFDNADIDRTDRRSARPALNACLEKCKPKVEQPKTDKPKTENNVPPSTGTGRPEKRAAQGSHKNHQTPEGQDG